MIDRLHSAKSKFWLDGTIAFLVAISSGSPSGISCDGSPSRKIDSVLSPLRRDIQL
jgi:hypothetical protein